MADVINTVCAINQLVSEDTEGLIFRAEKRYDDALEEIVKIICENRSIEIVLLAGPSSSGKTTTAKKLSSKLSALGHKAYTVSLDDFYRNAVDAIVDENGKPDYESVNSLELGLLSDVLSALVNERRAFIPRYDFDSGIRTDKDFEIILADGDVVILEGLHALNPIIYSALPANALLKLYISVSTRLCDSEGHALLTKRDLRLIRRTVRDFRFRSSSVENTFDMWADVLEGEQKYLAPYKYCADILIDSIHNYEPCVFKNEAVKLFETVDENSRWYNETKRLESKLIQFETISREKLPEDSLLREFLGK